MLKKLKLLALNIFDETFLRVIFYVLLVAVGDSNQFEMKHAFELLSDQLLAHYTIIPLSVF